MIRVLLPLPVVLPLLAAGFSVVFARYQRLQRLLSIATLVAVLVIAGVLLHSADTDGAAVVQLGGHPLLGPVRAEHRERVGVELGLGVGRVAHADWLLGRRRSSAARMRSTARWNSCRAARSRE